MCIWTYPWRKPEDEDYFGPVINLVFKDVKLDKNFIQISEAFFTSERHINISNRITDDNPQCFKLKIHKKSGKALSAIQKSDKDK
jgi:hypothetical protein